MPFRAEEREAFTDGNGCAAFDAHLDRLAPCCWDRMFAILMIYLLIIFILNCLGKVNLNQQIAFTLQEKVNKME